MFVPCCVCSGILIRYESWVVLFGRDSHLHKVTFRIYIKTQTKEKCIYKSKKKKYI